MAKRVEPSAVYFYGSPTKAALTLLKAREIPFKVFESNKAMAYRRKETADE